MFVFICSLLYIFSYFSKHAAAELGPPINYPAMKPAYFSLLVFGGVAQGDLGTASGP